MYSNDSTSGLSTLKKILWIGLVIGIVIQTDFPVQIKEVVQHYYSTLTEAASTPQIDTPTPTPKKVVSVVKIINEAQNNPPPAANTKFIQWAMELGAFLTEQNSLPHGQLSLLQHGDDIALKNDLKTHILVDGWGIQNRDQLLNTLEWVANVGHSQSQYVQFHTHLNQYPDLTETELVDQIATTVPTPLTPERKRELIASYRYVRANQEKTGDKLIYAWDYGRFVFLVRTGYTVGWLTEQESLALITAIGNVVSRTFHSWEDFGDNYVIGRIWWTQQDPQSVKDTNAVYYVLTSDIGPWSQIPWEWSEKSNP